MQRILASNVSKKILKIFSPKIQPLALLSALQCIGEKNLRNDGAPSGISEHWLVGHGPVTESPTEEDGIDQGVEGLSLHRGHFYH